jgi:hypothetical protein
VLTTAQRDLLAKLSIPHPKKIIEVIPQPLTSGNTAATDTPRHHSGAHSRTSDP